MSFSGKLVGVNITEGVVEHFRQYHREPVCDVFEQISFPMLSKIFIRNCKIGTWTRSIFLILQKISNYKINDF